MLVQCEFRAQQARVPPLRGPASGDRE